MSSNKNNSSSYLPSIKEVKKQSSTQRDFSPLYESAGELESELAYKAPADAKYVKKPPKSINSGSFANPLFGMRD